MSARILVVDDDRSMCDLLRHGLTKRGFDVEVRLDGSEAVATLDAEDFDVVITDLNMKGLNGIEICRRLAANRPNTPAIVITAFGSLETAIDAIRAGAYDFVQKPLELEALTLAVERAVQHRGLREELKRLRLAVRGLADPVTLIGESEPMRKLRLLIAKVSQADSTVLIEGETGTGKELVARAVHAMGSRSRSPFVALNCAAMPSSLLESELFGHVRGAFTDARMDRPGLFLQAGRGVVFLDEVAELPLDLQPKLLRALQERSVRPIGAEREVPFHAQVISATNRDLAAEVDEGRFRSDLFFRLNVISLYVPPLRLRGNDVLLLAQHFVHYFAKKTGRSVEGLSTPAAEKLLAYGWPGNVRELQNCIERAVALTNFQHLTVEDLPETVREPSRSGTSERMREMSTLRPLAEIEREYIEEVLERTGGNRTETARLLGLDRKTLYRKLREFSTRRRGKTPP
jgi:two-component system response regulator AtoC